MSRRATTLFWTRSSRPCANIDQDIVLLNSYFLKCYLILTIKGGRRIVRRVRRTILILEINEEENDIPLRYCLLFFVCFVVFLPWCQDTDLLWHKKEAFSSFLIQESSNKSLSGESNVCRKAAPVRSIQLAYLCHLVLCAWVFSDYRLVSVL